MATEPKIADTFASADRTDIVGAISLNPEESCWLSGGMTAGPRAGRQEVIGPQAPSLAAVPTGSRLHINIGATRAAPRISEDAMRKNLYIDQGWNAMTLTLQTTLCLRPVASRIDC
jgi:hypothetical protein